MTIGDLKALLVRAEQLDGPIKDGGARIIYPSRAAMNFFYGEVGDAAVIHAFLLDAQQRWIIGIGIGDETTVTFTDPGAPRTMASETAPSLLEAVLRAWIAARETEVIQPSEPLTDRE